MKNSAWSQAAVPSIVLAFLYFAITHGDLINVSDISSKYFSSLQLRMFLNWKVFGFFNMLIELMHVSLPLIYLFLSCTHVNFTFTTFFVLGNSLECLSQTEVALIGVMTYTDKVNSKSRVLDSIHPAVLNEYKDVMAEQSKVVCN